MKMDCDKKAVYYLAGSIPSSKLPEPCEKYEYHVYILQDYFHMAPDFTFSTNQNDFECKSGSSVVCLKSCHDGSYKWFILKLYADVKIPNLDNSELEMAIRGHIHLDQ